MRTRRCLAVAATLVALPAAWGASAQSAAADCAAAPVPYFGLAGADLRAELHESRDAEPVRYLRWRGTVPSFDGLPLSVDVTVPCGDGAGEGGPGPAVVMLHGFTDDKTVWEETGKSDTVLSRDRPQSNDRWNNIWFASRGYAVVNYTARGWHDSCGPEALTPACLGHQHWIHLDDQRWEVRDAQWLAGGLVQSGVADATRLAVTGGSYGGAPAAMAALLAGTVVCGGAPTPAALGPDPCAGRGDGDRAPWTTPDGRVPLTWAAALPLYTFGDLLQVLAPNGRATDGWAEAPPDQAAAAYEPFGVPVLSTVVGLLAAGATTGFYAPPGIDPDADIVVDSARLIAGNPFPPDDPFVARGVAVYRRFKSPIALASAPAGRVPILWVQGLTDPLFSGLEALRVRNHVLAAVPDYPFELFLGDLGHDYTGQRQDEWDLVKAQMNEFLDHFLRPDRTPAPPGFGVTATITRCLDHDAPMRAVRGPSWDALHPSVATFVGTGPVGGSVTTTLLPGPAGLATDPITGATLPLPGSYKGCRIMQPSRPDPTVVTYEFPLDADLVLLGGPVVDVTFRTTGPEVPLSVRLWDVAADGSAQGLVTRGTYRVTEGAGPARARFQLAPQGHRFPAGHRIKVEVTANDAPYLQPSNLPAIVTVDGLTLTVPVAPAPASAEPAAPAAAPEGPATPPTVAPPDPVSVLPATR